MIINGYASYKKSISERYLLWPDDIDILLKFCEQEFNQSRQIENQRAIITNIVLVIASAIIGFLTQKGLTIATIPLTIFLCAIGIYGSLTSQKYYERHQFHIERMRFWRKRGANE